MFTISLLAVTVAVLSMCSVFIMVEQYDYLVAIGYSSKLKSVDNNWSAFYVDMAYIAHLAYTNLPKAWPCKSRRACIYRLVVSGFLAACAALGLLDTCILKLVTCCQYS